MFVLTIIAALCPPVILILKGGLQYKNNPDRAKTLWNYAVIYLIVGVGVCGILLGA